MRSSTTRTTSTLRTRPEKNTCGRGLLSAVSCQCVQVLVRIPKDLLWKTHPVQSGQAPKEMTERQNSIQDKINFLKTHIRRKGPVNLQLLNPQPKEPVHLASAYYISGGSTDMDSMEISMRSDTPIQPSVTSGSVLSQHSTVDDQVMD